MNSPLKAPVSQLQPAAGIPAEAYDEMVTGQGLIRGHWQPLLATLSELGPAGLLERAENEVPARLAAAGTSVVPFQAGETLAWRFAGPA